MSVHDVSSRIAVVTGALVVLVATAGCSSSGGSAAKSAAASGSAGAGSSSQAITSAFTTFFSGKSDATTKIGLLQNGPAFASAIKAQASSGLAKSSSVKVTKVTTTSADNATVVFTVLLGGQPALKDQRGAAIRESGKWKVSASTFCALLTLEGQKPAACPATAASPSG